MDFHILSNHILYMSDIINFYNKIPKDYLINSDNPNYKSHLLNIPFRMIIVAASGSGKTNALLNIIKLFSKGKGTFSSIDIITRNKNEPLYNYLSDKSNQIMIHEGLQHTPNLDQFDKSTNHLVVFDDIILDKNQSPIIEYYIRSRKLNTSVIYIAQSYYAIPKLIRQNANYIIILKMSNNRNVNLLLSEFNLDISKKQLLNMYKYATKDKFNVFIIDVDKNEFRKNFTNILDKSKF